MKKIEKFDYQLIPSSHKGFKEVLVTFDYKGKTVHYYSFIKEKAKSSSKQYIAEAKKEIAELTRTGKIVKYAKKYLHYPVKETEEVKTVTVVKTVGVPQGKNVVYSNATAKKPRVKKPYLPFLAMCVFGVACLIAAITLVVINLVDAGGWPREWLIPDDVKANIAVNYYIAIGLGVLAVIVLAAGVPLFVKKLHNGGRVVAPKANKAAKAPKAKKKK